MFIKLLPISVAVELSKKKKLYICKSFETVAIFSNIIEPGKTLLLAHKIAKGLRTL